MLSPHLTCQKLREACLDSHKYLTLQQPEVAIRPMVLIIDIFQVILHCRPNDLGQ